MGLDQMCSLQEANWFMGLIKGQRRKGLYLEIGHLLHWAGKRGRVAPKGHWQKA
jgi:hypothetical protein